MDDAAVTIISTIHNHLYVFNIDRTFVLKASTTAAAVHIAKSPALEPESVIVSAQATAVNPASQRIRLFCSLSMQRANAKGNNAACTAANPAGFSYVPVMGKA
jgi:hypothetical protein